MKSNYLLAVAAMTLVCGGAGLMSIRAQAKNQANPDKKYHVVFELTAPEPEKWAGTIKNVDHLIEALGSENVELEVVMHGPGIMAVTKDQDATLAPQFERLKKEGVFLAACNNSLHGKNIAQDRVQPSFTVVPSGVAEVVKKQHDGWQYLKAAW